MTRSLTDGVSIREVATGQMIRRLDKTKEIAFSGMALSPDGRAKATSAIGGTVRLWETATGGPRRLFGPENESGRAVAIAPDGRMLAAAGSGGGIRIWHLPSGRESGQQQSAIRDGKQGSRAAAS